MNLRQLRYFCEVIEAGSAALAAARLHVAATAISMQLAQLEADLGGDLFDRAHRPMAATALGKFFYPRARELLDQAARLEQEAMGIASGRHGWLGVAFTRSSTFSILPRALGAFRTAYPEVQLDLVEALPEYQPEQLRQGRVDISIARFIGPVPALAGLTCAITLREPLVAALPASHVLAQRPSVSAAEFATLPFILYPKDTHSPYGQQLLGALKAAGQAPAVAYSTVEIHTALALVGASLGGTLVARSVGDNTRPDVSFVPVSDLQTGTTVVAITRAGEDSKLVAAFLRILLAGGAP